jgi:putative hydrolase of the HAD superfamily
MLRALVFDLDETLIDRQETMRRFLLDQHQRLASKIALSADEFASAVLSYQNGGYADKRVAYDLALSEYGAGSDLIDRLMSDFSAVYGEVAVCFPGVEEVLSRLHERFALGLISNGRSKGQRNKMNAAGITQYFDAIVISEEFGSKKPDPAIFLHCLKLLDLSAEEVWYVGDNPTNDIDPAMKLGMRTIWLRNSQFPVAQSAHAAINHVSELLLLIEMCGEPSH